MRPYAVAFVERLDPAPKLGVTSIVVCLDWPDIRVDTGSTLTEVPFGPRSFRLPPFRRISQFALETKQVKSEVRTL